MMTRDHSGPNAGSFNTRCHRIRFASYLVLIKASMACCQVRVLMAVSVPARYALAI